MQASWWDGRRLTRRAALATVAIYTSGASPDTTKRTDEEQGEHAMSSTDPRKLTVIEGRALPLPGHDIDTDRIIPARFLKAVSFEGLEAHVFEDDRRALTERGEQHPFDTPAYAGASVLVVNRNFGCGSSREHAPQALKRWGIQAVVGESFSEIFFGNSLVLGLPCVTIADGDATWLIERVTADPQLRVRVDVAGLTVTAGDRTVAASMPKAAHEALVSGAWDATGMLLDDFSEVQAVASRLPYVRGF
jgi:3-isopropylmalate/(R)-2-methylmalate dehydratase small subunit